MITNYYGEKLMELKRKGSIIELDSATFTSGDLSLFLVRRYEYEGFIAKSLQKVYLPKILYVPEYLYPDTYAVLYLMGINIKPLPRIEDKRGVMYDSLVDEMIDVVKHHRLRCKRRFAYIADKFHAGFITEFMEIQNGKRFNVVLPKHLFYYPDELSDKEMEFIEAVRESKRTVVLHERR